MTDFEDWWEVKVTGTIISEKGNPYVVDLEAIVANANVRSTPDCDYFKVWPKDSNDPQLPKNHDDKLWFRRSEAKVEVVSEDGARPFVDSEEEPV